MVEVFSDPPLDEDDEDAVDVVTVDRRIGFGIGCDASSIFAGGYLRLRPPDRADPSDKREQVNVLREELAALKATASAEVLPVISDLETRLQALDTALRHAEPLTLDDGRRRTRAPRRLREGRTA